ncbi:monovalent cation/H+ antiporter complex subunit F [Gemelliphila palaticanis]|uniref:PH regulation protein F n=1 Tax=Gemelliphila palaticanis TaxID=81950 RepID=A0ABX2T030_9BACL|nr:monovalent cation/H+ antiporter complex subunit F [Gemella palaticanis]MBF0715047.1 pH regulation protein F [Gemella palaticanis]NYS46977.1 pH regulation protein F [Gemella palaticanis]
MDKILDITILAGIFVSIAMIIFLLYYMVTRKSIFDKLIASDLIAMPLITLIVLVSMYYKTFSYISLILIIAVICFVGSVVTTRFLSRKEIFPNDDSK